MSGPSAFAGGSLGWQAPEQLQHTDNGEWQRQGKSVDIFAMGLLIYCCMSGGQHAFGGPYEREGNILQVNFPLNTRPFRQGSIPKGVPCHARSRISISYLIARCALAQRHPFPLQVGTARFQPRLGDAMHFCNKPIFPTQLCRLSVGCTDKKRKAAPQSIQPL